MEEVRISSLESSSEGNIRAHHSQGRLWVSVLACSDVSGRVLGEALTVPGTMGDDPKGGRRIWRAGAEEEQGTGNTMSRFLARGLDEK